jgi:di/tricarboxylate transporter
LPPALNGAFQLLLTLAGVTLLFGAAQANGTMERAAQHALRLCRGQAALLPAAFFAIAALLAMVGPGAILAAALVMPFAMNTAGRAGIGPFLTALMVANGANAGNLSPFSTVGVIVNGIMGRHGLGGHELRVWFFHGTAHLAVAAAAYLLFGGFALWRNRVTAVRVEVPRLEPKHAATAAIVVLWILGVVLAKWPLGWTAFAAAALVLALRLAPPGESVRRMPWRVIALVVSISTAVGLLERAGGLRWFQDLLASRATETTVHGWMAFLTGVISTYSSTSGVVLPAFLPMAKGIAARMPGVDPVALSISICIGSALVDVSPLSTLGALALAAAPAGADRTRLFRSLMAWGLAMSVAGAALCLVLSPWFAP